MGMFESECETVSHQNSLRLTRVRLEYNSIYIMCLTHPEGIHTYQPLGDILHARMVQW